MPIALPPISRRDFLRSSLALVGAACASHPRLSTATTTPSDTHTWALIADTHIAAAADKVWLNANMAENLGRIAEEILRGGARPSGVLINGDLAFDDGNAADYVTFLNQCKPLREGGLPLHLLLGNHDHRERFGQALKGQDRAAHEKAPQQAPEQENPPLPSDATALDRHVEVIEAERANLFLLDSLDETDKAPGRLGDKQIAWLAKALDKRRAKPAVIFVHHNPNPAGADPAKFGGLIDTDPLFAQLEPRKQVKCVVFGHTHVWGASERAGIHLVNLPPSAYLFNPISPNGWTLLTLGESGAKFELHTLNPKHTNQGQTFDLAWRKER